jgi:hypothetical protein
LVDIEAAMSLRAHIDQPATWTLTSRTLTVRGWCFATDKKSVTAIRLLTGLHTLPGSIGQSRPDVQAAIPGAPDLFTGFEIRGILPPGSHLARIEARQGENTWSPIVEVTIRVPRFVRPFWLGGGSWTDLMYCQVPTHPLHPPRAVGQERFPRIKKTTDAGLKLSIVTPSFNHARYLPETMQSVLDQTGCDHEYVVQDGGSTDGSKDLIRRESARLRAWTSEGDAGQADAIVRGFAKTSGGPDDIMAWINSDDFYLPGALACVTAYFERNPDVDVIYGHRILVDENSREIARWFLPKHQPEVLRFYDFVPQETLFWRRRIWDKVGGIDTSFQFAMDWDLLLRFQAAGAKIARIPYSLGCFRVHAAQKTTAQIHSIGQAEIDRLRQRTFGRCLTANELEQNPLLHAYLRRSAFIALLWKLGLRAP